MWHALSGSLASRLLCPNSRYKGPFKNDVTAKMRFLDPPPPSLVTIRHYFGLPPLPPCHRCKRWQTIKIMWKLRKYRRFYGDVTTCQYPLPPEKSSTIQSETTGSDYSTITSSRYRGGGSDTGFSTHGKSWRASSPTLQGKVRWRANNLSVLVGFARFHLFQHLPKTNYNDYARGASA